MSDSLVSCILFSSIICLIHWDVLSTCLLSSDWFSRLLCLATRAWLLSWSHHRLHTRRTVVSKVRQYPCLHYAPDCPHLTHSKWPATTVHSSQFTHQSTSPPPEPDLWLWTTRGLRRRMGARSLKCDCAYRCTGGDPEPNLFSVLPRSDALPLIGILGRFLQSYPRSITTPPPPATHDIYLSGGRHSGQLSHLSPIPAPLFSCNASLVALHPTLRHSLHARWWACCAPIGAHVRHLLAGSALSGVLLVPEGTNVRPAPGKLLERDPWAVRWNQKEWSSRERHGSWSHAPLNLQSGLVLRHFSASLVQPSCLPRFPRHFHIGMFALSNVFFR